MEEGKIYKGNIISTFGRDLTTDPQVYEVSGLTSSMEIVSAEIADANLEFGDVMTIRLNIETSPLSSATATGLISIAAAAPEGVCYSLKLTAMKFHCISSVLTCKHHV